MTFFQRLEDRCRKINSLLCIGLDPRHSSLPRQDRGMGLKGMIDENKRIIESTSHLVLAYKPNIAFYEALGAPGIKALEVTLEFIPDEIPVILDAKRGDIGATALAYEQAIYGHLGVDAVTLSPYMGYDSVEPFIRNEGKAAFLLCRTSNPGAEDIQLLETLDGESFYAKVSDIAVSWGENFGLVVAANALDALSEIRARHPGVWFLSPGIGTQGGRMGEAVSAGMSDSGAGILPVVARGISQAEDPAEAARKFLDELNRARDAAGTISDKRKYRAKDAFKRRFLGGLIDAQCFKTGEFTLKSGETSPFYIDLRKIMSFPKLMKDAARAYARLIRDLRAKGKFFDAIAGIPVAGLSLAQAVSLETGIPMIFPRMNAKSHGTGARVEGDWSEGDNVLLLDDLITAGTSKLEAVEVLKNAGLRVETLVVLIERGAAGRRAVENAGIELLSFAEIREFLPVCLERSLISEKQRTDLEAYASR